MDVLEFLTETQCTMYAVVRKGILERSAVKVKIFSSFTRLHVYTFHLLNTFLKIFSSLREDTHREDTPFF